MKGMPRSPQCHRLPSVLSATVPRLSLCATPFQSASPPTWTGTPCGTRFPWPRPPKALPPQAHSVPSLLMVYDSQSDAAAVRGVAAASAGNRSSATRASMATSATRAQDFVDIRTPPETRLRRRHP